eukprot:2173778-Heterocapsa_arctica.AAC.1
MRCRCGVKVNGLAWDENIFLWAWVRLPLARRPGPGEPWRAAWAALLKGREVIWTWACDCQHNLTDANELGEIDEPAYPLKTIG